MTPVPLEATALFGGGGRGWSAVLLGRCNDGAVVSAGRDDEQVRRIRRALVGRGELTRGDAEVLQGGRAGLGWFGRPSGFRTALSVAAVLFWVVVLARDVAVGVAFGRLLIPLVFVVLGVPALVLRWRRRRIIRRALGEARD